MSFIKNIFFLLICAPITIFLSIFAFFLRFSEQKLVFVYKTWARGVLLLIKYIYKIDYKINGLENIPNGSCVIASKHESMWETIIFLILLDKVSYILKSELLKIPFYGWHLKAMNMIPVDRYGGIKAMKKMLLDSKDKLNKGYKIVIFPQGTRVPIGGNTDDYPYHFGFISLYKEGFDVIPVSLNSGQFWPKGIFTKKHSGTIVMEVKPKLEKNLDNNSFKAILQEQIEGSPKS